MYINIYISSTILRQFITLDSKKIILKQKIKILQSFSLLQCHVCKLLGLDLRSSNSTYE